MLMAPCISDLLLIDGSSRASTAVKYITQSIWSHAALYIGNPLQRSHQSGDQQNLVEVEMVEGVRKVELDEFLADTPVFVDRRG